MTDTMGTRSGGTSAGGTSSGSNNSGNTGSGASSGDKSAPVAVNRDKTDQQSARPAMTEIKDLGGQLVSAARNGANSLYEEQRNRAADEISSLGEALQRSVKSLDGTLGEMAAPYAETAAQRVGDFADTLRQRSMAQIGSDIEGFARQWPAMFVAAAVGAGFIAGRFLLSSKPSLSDVVKGHSGAPTTGGDAETPRQPRRAVGTTGNEPANEKANQGTASGMGAH